MVRNRKFFIPIAQVVYLYLISLESAIGWFLSVGFYDRPRYEGYLYNCDDRKFDENNTCPLTGDNNYLSLRLLKGSCVELNYLGESIFITEEEKDLGHSFKGAYAKKCEISNHTHNCPDGSFVKEIEWDKRFELTKGIILSCYKPEFFQNNSFIMESHKGVQITESDERKCAAIYGITFKIDDEKDAVVGLDLKKNCTVGYGQGIRSSCLPDTALSGINFVIEERTNYIKNATIICSKIPNIASLCKPADEKQILSSYIGDTTNAEITLIVQKRFGVGKSLVMSDLNRNEFEFYRSAEFEFGKSIPELSENFKKNLGLSSNTDFDWGTSPDTMWQEEQNTPIEIKTKPGCTTEIFEIVGRCSFIDVRLTQYTRVDICDGQTNETVVDIPNDVVSMTYRTDIFSPVYKKKITNMKKELSRIMQLKLLSYRRFLTLSKSYRKC